LTAWAAVCSPAPWCRAQEGAAASAEATPLRRGWSENFSSRLNAVGYARYLDILDTPVNPGNIRAIPAWTYALEARPDLGWTTERLRLQVKPRAEITHRVWGQGWRDGDSETDGDAHVNGWLAQVRLADALFASYGREDLQWGPAYLVSSSNPFSQENGRHDPYLEQPGMDYAKVVVIPDSRFTATLIANTDPGRNDGFQEFRKTYALKIDYTVENFFAALIPSVREGSRPSIGAYAGWHPSDALLLYAESRYADETEKISTLAGATYTFKDGTALSGEYYHNGEGNADESILSAVGKRVGGNPGETSPYFRKHYLLLQAVKSRIWDRVHLTARWMANLDDDSSRLLGLAEWEFSDRAVLFVVGNRFCGDADTEFGSLFEWSGMAGMSFTY
jgi:hypothetical protein